MPKTWADKDVLRLDHDTLNENEKQINDDAYKHANVCKLMELALR